MVRSQHVAIHLVQHIFCKEREIVAAASVSLGGKDKFYDGGEIIPMPLMGRINSMTAMKFHHMDRTKATLHELGNTHSVEQIVGSHDKKSKYRPCVTINMVTCDESPFVAPLRGAREAKL